MQKKTGCHIVIFFVLAVILSSCATSRAGFPVPGKQAAAKARTPDALVPLWQPLSLDTAGVSAAAGDARLPADAAIAWLEAKTAAPRLELWALRIDLFSQNLRIVTAGGAGGRNSRNSDGSFPATTVSGFVRDNGLIAGINALPFDRVSGAGGEGRFNVGIVVSDGYMLSAAHPVFDALVFYADGSAAIVSQSEIKSIEDIDHAAGGFMQILKDGALTEHTDGRARHPRSAAGVSPDGKLLYLLVIDGRRPGSIGSTLAETAVLLRQLGAWDGINLDGGGSSSLSLRFPDGSVRPVNTPIDGIIPGRERAVGACLGVGMK